MLGIITLNSLFNGSLSLISSQKSLTELICLLFVGLANDRVVLICVAMMCSKVLDYGTIVGNHSGRGDVCRRWLVLLDFTLQGLN